MEIDEDTCVCLYTFLKRQEGSLPLELCSLLRRLETVVYENLSIEDVETLTAFGGDEPKGGTE